MKHLTAEIPVKISLEGFLNSDFINGHDAEMTVLMGFEIDILTKAITLVKVNGRRISDDQKPMRQPGEYEQLSKAIDQANPTWQMAIFKKIVATFVSRKFDRDVIIDHVKKTWAEAPRG
ncbi:MAG: hypothetical protein ACXWQE_00195 [Bdellovibrionales bacterium]